MYIAIIKKFVNQLGSSGTVKVISGLAGSNILGVVIGFIGTLVQARFVTPYDLGYFKSFSIVTGYVVFFNLGLFDSLHRLYPFYIGKGQKERALSNAEIGQAWSISVSAILSSVFMVLAVISISTGNWRAMLGWLVQTVAIAVTFYGGYLSAIYRSGHDFQTVAKSSVVSSVVSFFTLPLFLIWPYITLVLRSSLGSIASLIYLHLRRPLRLHWRFNGMEWYNLVKQGLPIFIASYGTTSLWSIIEMTIIIHFLGALPLGLWAMSATLFAVVRMVPESINAVYYPRIYERFGRTENVNDLWTLVRKPMLLSAAGMLFVVVCIWFGLPYIVPILMPKYVAAISIMILTMMNLPLIGLRLPYAFLVAKGEVIQQNVVTYASMGCFILLAMAALRLSMGLTGVVAASLLGQFVYVLLVYIFLFRSRRDRK